MRLDQAKFVVADAVNRMAIADKEVTRAMITCVAQLDEIIAYNKTTKAQQSLAATKATAEKFVAAVNNFTTEYQAKFIEIAAEGDTPAWTALKEEAATYASDFSALATALQAKVDAIQAVVQGGGTLQQIRDAIQAAI